MSDKSKIGVPSDGDKNHAGEGAPPNHCQDTSFGLEAFKVSQGGTLPDIEAVLPSRRWLKDALRRGNVVTR